MSKFRSMRREQSDKKSLGELFREGRVKSGIDPELFINGPSDFDCLYDRWARKEILTVLGASGIGKSEVVLYFLKEILKNNKEGVVCFISLEMTTQKIGQRVFEMLEEDELHLLDRFHIISNFREDETCKALGTEGIYLELKDIKNTYGDVLAFGLDHLHIVEQENNQDNNKVAQEFKNIAVSTNSFGILLSQVPKGKAQKGDIPLEADSSYNCSQLKWISSFIIQIHRPLIRIEEQIKMNLLSWSYVKIREQNKDDGVKVGQNKLLLYDMENRKFKKLSKEQLAMFSIHYQAVLEIRSEEEDSTAFVYDTSYRGSDGTVVQRTARMEKKDNQSDSEYIKNENKRVRKGYGNSVYKRRKNS